MGEHLCSYFDILFERIPTVSSVFSLVLGLRSLGTERTGDVKASMFYSRKWYLAVASDRDRLRQREGEIDSKMPFLHRRLSACSHTAPTKDALSNPTSLEFAASLSKTRRNALGH